MATVDGCDAPRIAASFMTIKDGKEALNRAFGKPDKNGVYTDHFGQRFQLQKNVKEYK